MQELSGLSEAASELTISRFRLIQPCLEQKRSLQLVASDAKICFRTAQRWVSQYRKLELVALLRKSREDRGARRVVSAKIKAAIEGLALERDLLCLSGPSVGRFASLPRRRASSRHDMELSMTWFVRFQAGYSLSPNTAAGHTSEAFDLVHRCEAPRSNAIWQADTTHS